MYGTKAWWVLVVLVFASVVAMGCGQSHMGDEADGRLRNGARHAATTSQGDLLERGALPSDPTLIGLDDDYVVPSQPVGVLHGSSDVSASGEYRYTLPLRVPRGRAGLEPALSLQYAGRAGDGRLGIGWSLVGLPEIRPCAATRATEGRTHGVDYGSTDRYCLDGKKLVAVRGEYGQDGTEYRTEENAFARIVSYRTAGDIEPGNFRVWTKDGRILDFGGQLRTARMVTNKWASAGRTGDLRDEGLRTVAWALATMSDRVGNVMTVNHGQTIEAMPGAGIEYWPEQIRYVRQSEGDPRQERAVHFEYETRPDPSFEYIAGIRFNKTRRLRDIKTFVASRSIAGYRLEYRVSQKTGRSLLSAVRHCDARGVCLSGKTFDWDADGGLVRVPWTEHPAPSPDIRALQGESQGVFANRLLVADLNGDGRDDVVYQLPTTQSWTNQERVRLSVGNSLSEPMQFSAPFTSWDLPPSRAVDTDNDGISELVVFVYNVDVSQVGWHVLRPSGNSFISTGTYIPAGINTTTGANLNVADFADADGDGRLDLFNTETLTVGGQSERHVFFSKNAGNGGFAERHDLGQFCRGNTGARVADVTADGRSEWVVEKCPAVSGPLRALGLAADGTTFTTDTTDMNLEVYGTLSEFVFIDVNGDGLKDALLRHPDFSEGRTDRLTIRWNTGHGFGPSTAIHADNAVFLGYDQDGIAPTFDPGIRVADIDGDGREDIVKFISSRDGVRPRTHVFLSRGDRFVSYEITSFTRQAVPSPTFGFVGSQLGDIDGDGMTDIVSVVQADPGGPNPLHVSLNTSLRPDLMMTVEDEREDPEIRRNAEVVRYTTDDRSTDWGPSQHTTAIPCVYPQRCIKRGMPVVKRLGQSTGVSAPSVLEFNWTAYTYADARADMLGRGFLGFGEQIVVDESRGTTTTIHFDHTTRDGTVYPFAGRPRFREEVVLGTGVARITQTTATYEINRYDGGLTYAVLPRQTATTVLDGVISHDPLRDDLLEQSWDSFGNEILRVERTLDGMRSRTETTMLAGPSFEAAWLVGLLAERRVSATQNGRPLPWPVRTARYTWDAAGQLTRVAIEPDKPELQHTVDYEYSQGLVRQVRTLAANHPARTVAIDYDADDVHPRRITNALGHVSWIRLHAGLDVPLIAVDPNGVASRNTYDGFGRIRSERGDDGHGADVDYGGMNAYGTNRYTDREVRVAVLGGPRSVTQFDHVGHPVFRRVETFDGRFAVLETVYDVFGRVVQQTRPDFEVPSVHSTYATYDALDRPTSVLAPDGAKISFAYDRLKTTVTDPAGNVVETVSDPNGRIIERAETSGLLRKSFYRYGDFGVLDAVEHSFQPATRFEYDGLGRMTKVIDADPGTRTFAYNAFGEPTVETNALGQTTQYERDGLGRMIARVDAMGRTTYGWDVGPFAIGKPVSSLTPDGTATGQTYDSAGRAHRRTTTVDGDVYASEQLYDAAGRLASRRYPVLGETPFDVTFSYTPTGYLDAVKSSSGERFFTVEARAADGQLERSRAGNGLVSESLYDARTGRIAAKRLLGGSGPVFDANYTYEVRGHVATRSENVSAVSETFGYDAAERLTSYVRSSPGSAPGQPRTVRTDYGYDVLSNLLSVTRDGTRVETNEYGADGRPHALAKATTAAGMRTFVYDANGRQTERLSASSQIERQIEYTPFDLPSMVHVRGNTQGDAEFRYNAYGQRVMKDYLRSSIVTVEGSYEARRCIGLFCSDPLKQVVYIPGDDGAAAQVEFDEDGNQSEVAYFQKDALGSVHATTKTGPVDERLFYEPFGQRITLAGEPLDPNSATPRGPSKVRRGFTGHDHDDDLGLIDMKGRVYDPLQRRFLTPDPFVMHAQGEYALRASVSSSNPLDWLGSGFDPLAPSAFVRGLAVARLLGRVLESNDPQGALGGVSAGSSDASGYQPSSVARASSPSRLGSISRPPGSAPTGAAAGPNLVASGSAADALAPAVGTSSQWEAHNPYSYTYNNPINYIDPTGYCGVCAIAVGAAVVIGFGMSAPSDTKEAPADLLGMGASLPGVGGFVSGVVRAVLPKAAPAAVAGAEAAVASKAGRMPVQTGIRAGVNEGVAVGGQPWRAFQPGEAACQSGCEAVAEAIQSTIGGTTKTFGSPGGPNAVLGGVRNAAGQFVNPAGSSGRGWFSHTVVVNEGRIYDALTGPAGMAIGEYKALWEFGNMINFGF